VTLTLATAAQLRDRMQNPGLDDATAARAIADASALVRAVAGQSFDYVENDTVELAGNGFDLILAAAALVVDVQHPVTVTERRYGIIFSPPLLEGYVYRRIGGVLRRYYRPWPDTVRVTYTHGFTSVPDWLTSAGAGCGDDVCDESAGSPVVRRWVGSRRCGRVSRSRTRVTRSRSS
jgi:hypothetical protein